MSDQSDYRTDRGAAETLALAAATRIASDHG